MSFPNSPNTRLNLISVQQVREKYKVLASREVIGIIRSLTREEWKVSVETKIKIEIKVQLNTFSYQEEKLVKMNDSYYRVERTFFGGQYVELYLSKTGLSDGDFLWEQSI